jgi:hypothetical protein
MILPCKVVCITLSVNGAELMRFESLMTLKNGFRMKGAILY